MTRMADGAMARESAIGARAGSRVRVAASFRAWAASGPEGGAPGEVWPEASAGGCSIYGGVGLGTGSSGALPGVLLGLMSGLVLGPVSVALSGLWSGGVAGGVTGTPPPHAARVSAIVAASAGKANFGCIVFSPRWQRCDCPAGGSGDKTRHDPQRG